MVEELLFLVEKEPKSYKSTSTKTVYHKAKTETDRLYDVKEMDSSHNSGNGLRPWEQTCACVSTVWCVRGGGGAEGRGAREGRRSECAVLS